MQNANLVGNFNILKYNTIWMEGDFAARKYHGFPMMQWGRTMQNGRFLGVHRVCPARS